MLTEKRISLLATKAPIPFPFFKNTSDTNFISFASALNFPVGSDPFTMAVADFNGDGKLDIAVANLNHGSQSTVSLLMNNGQNGSIHFVTSVYLTYASGFGTTGIAVGDLNNDGKTDFVVCGNNSGAFSVFQNVGTSVKDVRFLAKQDFTSNGAEFISVSDIDGDGKAEVIVDNLIFSKVSIFDNESDGSNIILIHRSDGATGSFPNNISIADINLDRRSDLVVSNYSANSVSVLKNTAADTGYISFDPQKIYALGSNPERTAVTDLDGDGKPDIIAANEQSDNISVLKNVSTKSTISFLDKVDYPTGSNPTSVTAGDLNGDGKPELIVTNNSSGTISILQNEMAAPQAVTHAQLSPPSQATY